MSYSVSSEIGAFSPADKASNGKILKTTILDVQWWWFCISVEESYDNEAFQNDSGEIFHSLTWQMTTLYTLDSSPVGNGINTPDVSTARPQ